MTGKRRIRNWVQINFISSIVLEIELTILRQAQDQALLLQMVQMLVLYN